MASLSFPAWPFFKSEKVSIHWFRSPYRNAQGEWVFDVVFREQNGSVAEHVTIHWGALPWLRLGQYVINGKPLLQMTKGTLKILDINHVARGKILPAKHAISKEMYKLFVPENYDELCWVHTIGRKKLVVPCFEIVRTFLAPTKFLANALLNPAGMHNLVKVIHKSGTKLHLKVTKEIPKSYIENKRNINHLVWLLTNNSAKRVWHEVYDKFMLQGISHNPINPIQNLTYSNTNLLFASVPLVNRSTWQAYVIESEDTVLVLSILESSGLEHEFKDIDVEHEGTGIFREFKRAKEIVRTYKDESKNKKLDDSMQSSYISNEKDYEDIEKTKLIFSVKPKINLVSDERHRKDFIKKYAVDERETMIQEVVSTVESVAGGKKRPIEFRPPLIEFETDIGGLEDFIKAIELLQEHDIEVVELMFGELPGDKGITFVAEGIRRKYVVVRVKDSSGTEHLILEIGRPDKYSCSTLFIQIKGFYVFDEDMVEVSVKDALTILRENNGAWEKESMKNDTYYTYKFLKHMQQDTSERWAEKLKNKVQY